jgi:hypothetical protein
MNRFLVPAAAAALVAGCAMPDTFGLQRKQLVVVESVPAQAAGAPTIIERDIYHEVPVVQVDTVYMEAEPVYVEDEYNETYVFVSEPRPPHREHPRWSPREQEPPGRKPRPRVPSPVEAKPLPPGGKPVPTPSAVIVPKESPKKTGAPVTADRRKSPDRPTPPEQLAPPKRKAPAPGDSVPPAPARRETPKQAPTPPADKPAGPGSGA